MTPAVLDAGDNGRVLLFSFGSTTSGIPREWSATNARPGVNLLNDLSEATAAHSANRMRQFQRPSDLLIASIHWGSNWGYHIPPEQIAFAHRLAEEGVGVVHGHSSHHVKAIEIFKGCLILYGCGDFLTDYEGISGYEKFRGDLAVMYLIELDPTNGQLVDAQLVPMQMRLFRIEHTSAADAAWLCDLLNKFSGSSGTQTRLNKDESLTVKSL